MSAVKTTILTGLLTFGLILLQGCATLDFLSNLGEPAPRTERQEPSPEAGEPAPQFTFEPLDTPHCSMGDETVSIVSGRIFEGGAPAVGAKVDASSQPGGNPISPEPAETDENGNYAIHFVCSGAACNGPYWVWTVNDEYEQTSPFVQFNFDPNCRRGTLNFIAP
jgi:hypothetical protein